MAPLVAVAMTYVATLAILTLSVSAGFELGWVALFAVVPASMVGGAFWILSRVKVREQQ